MKRASASPILPGAKPVDRTIMNDNLAAEMRFSIIPEWITDADISDKAVRLYSVLARYADNQTHEAFPSRETLAERMRCCSKSVDRATAELIEIGAVTKKQRHNSSLVYTLRVVQGGGHQSPGGSTPESRGVDTTVHLTRTTELQPSNDINAHFDKFWAAYPRKKGKGQARKAFEKALEKTDLPTILAGVADYVAHEDMEQQQFVAHPSTWLNAERWDDEHTEVKVLSKSPYVGGVREWVKGMHDLGEHFECRPGEFGCK